MMNQSLSMPDLQPVTATKGGALALADHTFVVPAYKQSPFLADCLASLRRQTMESRVVVATSTPTTAIAEAATSFEVPVIVNPAQRGIGADWNFALAQAQTRYVTLAHQDDVYAPDFVAASLDLFARHPRASLTFTNFRQISDDGTGCTSKVSRVKDALLAVFVGHREIVAGPRGRWLLSAGNPISCSSVTFDRFLLGGFCFSEELASNLDWEAWLRLIERGASFAYNRNRLVDRRYNDLTETSRLIRDGRRRAEDQMMFERIWPQPLARIFALAYSTAY